MKMNSSRFVLFALFISCTLVTIPLSAHAASIDIWWPTDGAHVSGTQPFKALIPGMDVSQYTMYWQVDNGQLNQMPTNNTDSPHKEASVDLSGWNWQPTGVYQINFVAKDQNGNVIATQGAKIYLPNATQSQSSTPVSNPAPAPATTTPATPVSPTPPAETSTPGTNPTPLPAPADPTTTPLTLAPNNSPFYVDPNSEAAVQAAAWQQSDPGDAAKMEQLASEPTAVWLGGWDTDVESTVAGVMQAATTAGKTAEFVAYNIPDRDCGGYSSGGAANGTAYLQWIQSVAQGIGSGKALVILEPDAVAESSCLSSSDQTARFALLAQAIRTLKANPNASVYLDAGHSGWVDPYTMATDLRRAGIGAADGFSLNVSNFDATSDETAYGAQISSVLGGKHFVIDTSRNGNGSNGGQWCNPSGSAIGTDPTTQTGNPLVDAFLWVKVPGESDGTCNGGPAAGVWWPSYALDLVNDAH